MEVECKEPVSGEPVGKENWIVAVLNSSVVAASVTVLLGTLFSGILLERFKQNTLEIDRARQKQESLINNQFDVLEKLNTILVNYFFAAEYLIFEIVEREGEGFTGEMGLTGAIANYDTAGKLMHNNLMLELFRVRMYFQDEKLHDLLMTHARNFSQIEGEIATKLIDYKKKQRVLDPENREQWQAVRSRLRHAFDQTRHSLNQLADKMAAKN